MPKENMTVGVNVNIHGTIDSNNQATVTADYSGSSNPPASSGKTVVASDGTIDLTAINRDKNKYKKDVDISYIVGGIVRDSQGNMHGFRWPEDPNNPGSGDLAISVTGKNPGKFTSQIANAFTLVLEDQDDDGEQYHYTLQLHIEPLEMGGSGWTVPIDPVVINRGGRD